MNNIFGKTLREHRRNSKVSQRDLANRIGVDFSYISKIENGRLPAPSADTIVKICNVLEIEPEELLALTKKLPSDIQDTVSSSKTAQEFLSEVQRMKLNDDEWNTMIKSLRNLRSDK